MQMIKNIYQVGSSVKDRLPTVMINFTFHKECLEYMTTGHMLREHVRIS